MSNLKTRYDGGSGFFLGWIILPLWGFGGHLSLLVLFEEISRFPPEDFLGFRIVPDCLMEIYLVENKQTGKSFGHDMCCASGTTFLTEETMKIIMIVITSFAHMGTITIMNNSNTKMPILTI